MYFSHERAPATSSTSSTSRQECTFTGCCECLFWRQLHFAQVSSVDMAKLLLGDAADRSTERTSEALSDQLILHRPRIDSMASTASLDCLADVAKRELDMRVSKRGTNSSNGTFERCCAIKRKDTKISQLQMQERLTQLMWLQRYRVAQKVMYATQRNAVPLEAPTAAPSDSVPSPFCNNSGQVGTAAAFHQVR